MSAPDQKRIEALAKLMDRELTRLTTKVQEASWPSHLVGPNPDDKAAAILICAEHAIDKLSEAREHLDATIALAGRIQEESK